MLKEEELTAKAQRSPRDAEEEEFKMLEVICYGREGEASQV